MSRLQILDRALASHQSGVLSRLMEQAPVFGFAFADDVAPVALQDDRGTVKSIPVQLGGSRSDLTGALRAVRDKMQGQPVQAIVVCSDGRQTVPEPGLAGVLSTAAAPIYTVGCAGPVRKDQAITRCKRLASPRSRVRRPERHDSRRRARRRIPRRADRRHPTGRRQDHHAADQRGRRPRRRRGFLAAIRAPRRPDDLGFHSATARRNHAGQQQRDPSDQGRRGEGESARGNRMGRVGISSPCARPLVLRHLSSRTIRFSPKAAANLR